MAVYLTDFYALKKEKTEKMNDLGLEKAMKFEGMKKKKKKGTPFNDRICRLCGVRYGDHPRVPGNKKLMYHPPNMKMDGEYEILKMGKQNTTSPKKVQNENAQKKTPDQPIRMSTPQAPKKARKRKRSDDDDNHLRKKRIKINEYKNEKVKSSSSLIGIINDLKEGLNKYKKNDNEEFNMHLFGEKQHESENISITNTMKCASKLERLLSQGQNKINSHKDKCLLCDTIVPSVSFNMCCDCGKTCCACSIKIVIKNGKMICPKCKKNVEY